MSALKVLVTTSSFGTSDPAPIERLRKAGLDPVINPYGRRLTEDEVRGLIEKERPVGMVAGIEPLTAGVLESAAGLKVISRCGIGLDSVDLAAAGRLGIKVMNTPDAPSVAVAELTLGLILGLLRRIAQADRAIRSGEWKAMMGRLLGAQTVGVVGCGRVGGRVASLCKAFGAEVVGHDPYAGHVRGITMTGLDDLLGRADVVTLHLGYSAETRHIINAEKLARMKKGAVVINTSRGGLIDEDALYAAISEGRIGGAGLDTYEEEPYKGPLRELPRVLMTAHMGSYASESRVMMEAEAADNLISGLRDAGVI